MENDPRTLEQFFTKRDLAKELCDEIPVGQYSLVVEPSCGDGAFLQALFPRVNNMDYMDIAHLNKKHRRDFLTYEPNVKKNHNVLTIGNPPFSKAVKFFNHAAKFSVLIAFILPRSFQKKSIQNRLALNMHLTMEKILPKNSFLFQGKDYDVPCVWQIWQKTSFLRIPWEIKTTHPDFDFVSAEEEPDVAIRRVGVNAGRIFTTDVVTRAPQSHLFLKFKADDCLERLQGLDLENCEEKYQTAGVPSISKSEICDMLCCSI